MKGKVCELCTIETKSGYYIDIMYITGLPKPIPACDQCRELLKAAKDRIDSNKVVAELDQKIRLGYLLRVALTHLEKSIMNYGVRQ